MAKRKRVKSGNASRVKPAAAFDRPARRKRGKSGNDESVLVTGFSMVAATPMFLPMLAKDAPSSCFVPRREMWQHFIKCQPNLSFKQGVVQRALVSLKEAKYEANAWSRKMTREQEDSWLFTTSTRFDQQCKYLNEAMRKRGDVKWLAQLKVGMPAVEDGHGKAIVGAEEDFADEYSLAEETEEEWMEEEEPELADEQHDTTVEASSAASVAWFVGFDWGLKKAYRSRPGNSSQREFVCVSRLQVANDQVVAKWGDGAESVVADVSVTDLEEMQGLVAKGADSSKTASGNGVITMGEHDGKPVKLHLVKKPHSWQLKVGSSQKCQTLCKDFESEDAALVFTKSLAADLVAGVVSIDSLNATKKERLKDVKNPVEPAQACSSTKTKATPKTAVQRAETEASDSDDLMGPGDGLSRDGSWTGLF